MISDEENRKNLAMLDRVAKRCPDYFGSAANGALIGMLANFLVSWRDKTPRHIGQYAGFGALAGLAYELLACGGIKGLVRAGRWANEHEVDDHGRLVPKRMAPETPVVTKGHFAGSPRPLYFTGDAWDTSSRGR